jgi:hypothetical protein
VSNHGPIGYAIVKTSGGVGIQLWNGEGAHCSLVIDDTYAVELAVAISRAMALPAVEQDGQIAGVIAARSERECREQEAEATATALGGPPDTNPFDIQVDGEGNEI